LGLILWQMTATMHLYFTAHKQNNTPTHQNTRQVYGAAAELLFNTKRETHTTQAAAINTAASSFQMDQSKGGRIQMDLQKREAT
jgi:hypothetical protein